MENFSGNESDRLGKRAAETISGAVEVAGQKLDAAVDYVGSAKNTLGHACQDGWKGMKGLKGKVMEYTRTDPLNALLIAAGTGLVLGWLTKRARG